MEKVKNIRAEKNLTLEDVARRAGLSTGTVWQIETGRIQTSTVGTLEKLARGLGVPLSELMPALKE